jgi:hypothetical protein
MMILSVPPESFSAGRTDSGRGHNNPSIGYSRRLPGPTPLLVTKASGCLPFVAPRFIPFLHFTYFHSPLFNHPDHIFFHCLNGFASIEDPIQDRVFLVYLVLLSLWVKWTAPLVYQVLLEILFTIPSPGTGRIRAVDRAREVELQQVTAQFLSSPTRLLAFGTMQ